MDNGKYYYKEQLVGFLDLLGFSNIVDSVQDKPELAAEKIEFLDKTIKNIREKNLSTRLFPDDNPLPQEPKYKIFSDCICIASDCIVDNVELKISNVFMFLLMLLYIQAELTLHGIFVRGAVTINWHFQNEDIVFSSALINAYYIESKKAIYPRIIIDESVIAALQKTKDTEANFHILNSLIKRDADGLVFLDYLEYANELDHEEYIIDFFQEHRKLIEQQLNQKNEPKIKGKYLWLARYHNQKVKEFFTNNVFLAVLLIPQNLLGYDSFVFSTVYTFSFSSIKEKVDEGVFLVVSDDFNKAKKAVNNFIRKNKNDYILKSTEYSPGFQASLIDIKIKCEDMGVHYIILEDGS